METKEQLILKLRKRLSKRKPYIYKDVFFGYGVMKQYNPKQRLVIDATNHKERRVSAITIFENGDMYVGWENDYTRLSYPININRLSKADILTLVERF